MILLASLAVGVVAYLAVGLITGFTPHLRRLVRPARERPDRQVWLIQAGSDLSVAQFVTGSVAAGVVVLALVALLTGDPLVAFVPAAAAGLLPAAYFGRRRARLLLEVQQAWPDGVRHLIGGIQSGLSLQQSIAGLASSGPEPLRVAFDRFTVNARMMGVPAALEVVKAQLADPTSDRVLEVLLLAHEQGGRIVVEVLRDLADATARDLKTMEEIASDQVEPKINSWAVFALPWLVLVLLTATQGSIRRFYGTPAGAAVIVVAALMSLAGILIVYRLSRQAPEQRVLAGRPPGAGVAR
ncbi:MAG TPA: type II secretion system F family protein [Actinomycetota bacterium]|nr:type II secretion system F family protein [Actinomycetota bacterium]